MRELSTVDSFGSLHSALHKCCSAAIRCEASHWLVGPACAHMGIGALRKHAQKPSVPASEALTNPTKDDTNKSEIARVKLDATNYSSNADSIQTLEEVMLLHPETATRDFTCWCVPDRDPVSLQRLTDPVHGVMRDGMHIAGKAIPIVNNIDAIKSLHCSDHQPPELVTSSILSAGKMSLAFQFFHS